jgi:hypothetical protein
MCPKCEAPLGFDPWSPDSHRCSRCAAATGGDRHHRHWARTQHLWLAERAAHLAAVGVFADDERYAARARELMAPYHELYFELANRDNVLGPAHLFFSTYLESMWILNYLAAADLLRGRGWLPPDEIEAVNAIADEAANIIGEFNEGMSNRQTWNAAALTAIAVWFGDEELATAAIQSPTGLLGHLTDGFGDDGMWFEGENYHLFAMRGLLTGMYWARTAGVDLLENPELADHFADALMAPVATALPDLTFPARRDSRFGVSLAHPAYVECWEAGLTALGDAAPDTLVPWLRALYQTPSRPAATYDAYLHDAGEPGRSPLGRADLSWWMLLAMTPELPPDSDPIEPASTLLVTQGVAVLRQHDRYVSLECGGRAGGHGHPDDLHLTLHAGGVHWLADPGAGSYVTRDLFWYRSALAHNAPRIVGAPDKDADARCIAFDDAGDWGWTQARAGKLRRSVVQGPEWILDVVDRDAGEGTLELPWHLEGSVQVETRGTWTAADLGVEFVTDAERFEPYAPGVIQAVTEKDDNRLRLSLLGGTLFRAGCPGRPGADARGQMLLLKSESGPVRLVAVLGLTGTAEVAVDGDAVLVTTAGSTARVTVTEQSATVQLPDGTRSLGGSVPPPPKPASPIMGERWPQPAVEAYRLDDPPALDGSFEGFDLASPIELGDELHYRRSEEPYQFPEQFSAVAYANWDERAVYLAVEVTKPDVVLRPADAPPLSLDNEPDDIHADGVQVYLRRPGEDLIGYLIRPAPNGAISVRSIPGDPAQPVALAGASAITEQGYALAVALPCAGLELMVDAPRLEFEIVVNEMRPERMRRAGQLAWAGGGGWVYLRGDRVDPARVGLLELKL